MECYEACPLNDCWAKCSWFICDVSVVVWIYKWCGLEWSVAILRLALGQIFVWCVVFDKQIFTHGLMVVHEMMVGNIKSWRIDRLWKWFFTWRNLTKNGDYMKFVGFMLYSYEISIRLVLFYTPKKSNINHVCFCVLKVFFLNNVFVF